MGIRDEELKRLVKYAEGMGLKVRFLSKKDPGESASWTLDGTEIIVNDSNLSSKAKIDLVLDMVHELGHHLWFIHEKERQPDLKFDEAVTRQNLFEEEEATTPAPKKLRKKILSVEIAGTKYWEVIYKETNLKFPLWKLYAQMEFDIWMYEEYYKTGIFPKRKAKLEKSKEFNKKHRPSK